MQDQSKETEGPVYHSDLYAYCVNSLIQREVTRSHRIKRHLTESLLLADDLRKRKKISDFSCPFSSILDIFSFAQHVKWLCPWGIEMYDEVHRSPLRDIPEAFQEEFHKLEDGSKSVRVLPQKKLRDLIDDASQQIERLFLYKAHNLSILENLFKHPCEELYIYFSDTMSKSDVERIVRCTSIRVLCLECGRLPEKLILALNALPNLQILRYEHDESPSKHIETLRKFPQLRAIDIGANSGRTTDSEAQAICEFIRERKQTLQHVHFSSIIKPEIANALVQCPNLVSFSVENPLQGDEGVCQFFENPSVQRRIQHVKLIRSSVGERTFFHLSKFTNLRWLDVSLSDITTDQLRAILLANSNTIREVIATNCALIDDGIMAAIGWCAYLEKVDLRGTSVHMEAVMAYGRRQKSNVGAISITAWDDAESEDEISDTELSMPLHLRNLD